MRKDGMEGKGGEVTEMAGRKAGGRGRTEE
jgi:hypothetical protein